MLELNQELEEEEKAAFSLSNLLPRSLQKPHLILSIAQLTKGKRLTGYLQGVVHLYIKPKT